MQRSYLIALVIAVAASAWLLSPHVVDQLWPATGDDTAASAESGAPATDAPAVGQVAVKVKVQDAYSMRSSPQVIGAARDQFETVVLQQLQGLGGVRCGDGLPPVLLQQQAERRSDRRVIIDDQDHGLLVV